MDKHIFQAVLFVLVATFTHGQLCEKLDSGLFATCIRAGINTTISFTTFSSNPSKKVIVSSLTSQTINELKRCSPYVGFLICSVSVPKCLDGVYKPVLPCKRVCEDVVRGCDVNRVHNGDVEWLKGLCRILPDTKDTKCIEPKSFNPIHRKVPIQKNCTKLFIPQCRGFGFNYTMKSFIEQLYLSRHFDSILNKTVTESSSSYCRSLVRELLCTELIPPCFEDKITEPAIYTVCKTRCQVLWRECPSVLTRQFGIFEDCSMEAEHETDYAGFCRVTKWPGTNKWLKAKTNIVEVLDTADVDKEPAVHVIAILITSLVVITVVIITTATYCHAKRRRVFNMRGYWRHGDEEEEEMTVIMST